MAQILSACKCQGKKCVCTLLRQSCEKCVVYSSFYFKIHMLNHFNISYPSLLTLKIFYHKNTLLQSKNQLSNRTQPAMLQNKLLDN